MFAVILVVVLTLPGSDEKPVVYTEKMTIAECNAAVREMTYRAPAELKDGGKIQIGCVVVVPKSENP